MYNPSSIEYKILDIAKRHNTFIPNSLLDELVFFITNEIDSFKEDVAKVFENKKTMNKEEDLMDELNKVLKGPRKTNTNNLKLFD